MNNKNNDNSVIVEYYTRYDLKMDNICVISLFKKENIETITQTEEHISELVSNEDLFLSWLASLSSSHNSPLVRVVLKINGVSYEAIYNSTIDTSIILNFPYISKVKRIYIFTQLKPQELQLETGEIILKQIQNNTTSLIVRDLTSDEFYVFHSPIKLLDQSKVAAIVLETVEGVAYIKTDELMKKKDKSKEEKEKSSSGKKKKKKRKKRKRKKKSSRSKAKSIVSS